jgi:hypothetical protein
MINKITKSTIFWDITPCSPLNVKLTLPEDGTLHNHRCENIKSYNNITFQIATSLHICVRVDQGKNSDTLPYAVTNVYLVSLNMYGYCHLFIWWQEEVLYKGIFLPYKAFTWHSF